MLASCISKGKHRLWHSGRLQDQKPHHCLTGYEVAAPGERLNFCSYHTIPGRRAWQTSSLAQRGASLAASTAKENRSSGSNLPSGWKMDHFRQLIPIKRAIVKDLLLQREKNVNTLLIKDWYKVTAELGLRDNIDDILNCCRSSSLVPVVLPAEACFTKMRPQGIDLPRCRALSQSTECS